jgi:hypothetical protein
MRRLRLARSAARTTSQSAPKVYASKHQPTYQILWHPDRSCCRDKVNRAAGRRAGALFFAHRLDYFIMTKNSQSLPGFGTVKAVSSGPVSARPPTGTGKKRGTPTRTPTQLNRRAVSLNRFQ